MRRALLLVPLLLLLAVVVPTPATAGRFTPAGSRGPSEVLTADAWAAQTAVAVTRGGHARALSPAELRALPAPFACSDYNRLASVLTPAGNLYETQGNVCLFDSTGTFDIGAVARFKCFRNSQLYGNGYGGCRWVWNQVMQRSNDGGTTWQTMTSNDNCYTCEGVFVADTGRFYGNQTYALWCGYALRAATRGTATQSYLVRIKLVDGSEEPRSMKVNIGKAWRTPC